MTSAKAIITGGHLSPALATIDALQSSKWHVLYIGRKSATDEGSGTSDEYQVITARQISFYPITSGKWHRYSIFAALHSIARVPVGLFQAIKILIDQKPQIIISFGGYLSTPVVVAGWCLRIPIITHEQTVDAGLANRINAFFANYVCISFEASRKYFPSSKTIFTGNPVRTQALQVIKTIPQISQVTHRHTIYVTGGNQGSYVINQIILSNLSILTKKYNIIHSFGIHPQQDAIYNQALEQQRKLSASQQSAYIPARYFHPDEIGSVLQSAHLVISRAGANTCTELANLNKPVILIPLTTGQKNEQMHNAQLMKELGIAEILIESNLSSNVLLELIDSMIKNIKKYSADPSRIKSIFPLDAANQIVNLAQKICQY